MMTVAMPASEISQLLSVDEAIAIIDATPVLPRVVDLPLPGCLGLRLAEDLYADRDYPPADKSLMDGYAVRADDVARPPARLHVIGEVAAGGHFDGAIVAGQAVSIMTGAPLPNGADGVVPIEDTELEGQTVHVLRARDIRRYAARAGGDARKGDRVLPAGVRLEAGQLAVAATIGAAILKVHPAPRVAVLSTGDEVVPFDRSPSPSQVRSANNIMLTALLRRTGCRVADLGIVADRPELIRQALLKGMQLDALLVSGGMSMGRFDFVPRLLAEMGAQIRISKIRIKPGKPFIFATIDRRHTGAGEPMPDASIASTTAPLTAPCYIFGLPGNPVSAFVCTLRLVCRLLARLVGGAIRAMALGDTPLFVARERPARVLSARDHGMRRRASRSADGLERLRRCLHPREGQRADPPARECSARAGRRSRRFA